MGTLSRTAGNAFFNKLEASRMIGTICSAAADAGWAAHCGDLVGVDLRETEKADLVIAWGINAKVTSSHWIPFINQARKNGAKLVVIDPYKTATAKSADFHFQVKPGGDAALALGVLKRLHEDNALDKDFIDKYTTGFEELESYLKTLTFAEISENAGIEPKQINQLAKLLKENQKIFIRIGLGLSRNSRGAMSVRAIASLGASLGLFQGKPGAAVFLDSACFHKNAEVVNKDSLSQTPRREINMVQLGEALSRTKDPIKLLFVYNSNPLTVAPDSSSVLKGLQREDLFTVVHEHFKTPTAEYADILLPATTSFENDDFFTSYGHSWAGITEPVIKPLGEAKSNFELFRLLSEKMSFQEHGLLQNADERIKEIVSTMDGVPADYQVDMKRSTWFQSDKIYQANHFLTGKARFKFSIETAAPTVPRIACLMEARDFDHPDLKSRYPFMMMTPPSAKMLNSTFGESYTKEYGEILIHPETAKVKGILNGELVRVYNQRGEHIRIAKVTEDTQPGLLIAEAIYWNSHSAPHLSVNVLTSQATTDLGEGGVFHEIRVQIEKVS
jgi:anaerobic selenocysteine-containing dehydrogenase